MTMRPALVLLPVAVAITFGCAKQETFSLPLESDPFFLGSQRTVIRPVGDPWVIHYFPNESPDAVLSRIENAAFFKEHQFRRVVKLRNGKYSISLPTKGVGSGSNQKPLAAIMVYSGRATPELKVIEGSSGTTVELLPSLRNEN
ncbi:MAG TPA: hypothetical protein PLS15_12710 [Fimbriimonadaceae bacterium]|nr:hypothetical protein [Fimbriimonadaceae bacterium]